MTSEERREIRYWRRKQRREATRLANMRKYDCFDRVFSFEHLYQSYRKCRLGVRWKASTQKYIANALLNIGNTQRRLMNGTFQSRGFHEFDICERGKMRHIRSVDIHERVVQRCLCDYALIPVLSKSFIYDNGASLRGKGYSFSVNRLRCHLRKFYRKHGCNGYILLFDFSKYFDSIPHALIADIMNRYFTDGRIINLTMHFVKCFGEVGLGLGSQISQIFALAAANRLDHYIKDILRIKWYGRYMDDGYVICSSKEELLYCKEELQRIASDLGLTLNENKTRIVPLWKDFTWLKIKFRLLPEGKLLQRAWRQSIVRQRRKMKKFKNKIDAGVFTKMDAYHSYTAWKSHLKGLNAKHSLNRMDQLYRQLFA